MEYKETISIDAFVDNQYTKKATTSPTQEQAVITHYLHNFNNDNADCFKEEGMSFTTEPCRYVHFLTKKVGI